MCSSNILVFYTFVSSWHLCLCLCNCSISTFIKNNRFFIFIFIFPSHTVVSFIFSQVSTLAQTFLMTVCVCVTLCPSVYDPISSSTKWIRNGHGQRLSPSDLRRKQPPESPCWNSWRSRKRMDARCLSKNGGFVQTHIYPHNQTRIVCMWGVLWAWCVCLSLAQRERERERELYSRCELFMIMRGLSVLTGFIFIWFRWRISYLLPSLLYVGLSSNICSYLKLILTFFYKHAHRACPPYSISIHPCVSPMSDWHSLLRSRRLLFLSSSIKVCFFNLYYFILLWRCLFYIMSHLIYMHKKA